MNTPLADRIRPAELCDVVGQKHLLSEGKALYNMIENGEIPNLIFTDPPESAKQPLPQLLRTKQSGR